MIFFSITSNAVDAGCGRWIVLVCRNVRVNCIENDSVRITLRTIGGVPRTRNTFWRKTRFRNGKNHSGTFWSGRRSFRDFRRDEFVLTRLCCRGSGAVLFEIPTAGSDPVGADRTLRRRMYRAECFYIDARLIIDTTGGCDRNLPASWNDEKITICRYVRLIVLLLLAAPAWWRTIDVHGRCKRYIFHWPRGLGGFYRAAIKYIRRTKV